MKLRQVHNDTAVKTRAGADGIQAGAVALKQGFSIAGASLGLGNSPAPSRHI